MRIPQDMTNLLALCIKNLIWFKANIFSFYKECGVPTSILIDFERKKNTPTLKLVPELLEALYERGDEGFKVASKILTSIYYWKDIHSVPSERKDEAVKSLQELQKAYKLYTEQEKYKRQVESQKSREVRLKKPEINHKLLQGFRDRFDEIYFFEQHDRGDAYEKLMNDIFLYYFPNATEGFKRTGEQIDGQFYFDGHWYFIEVRWRKELSNAADISVLRDRARKGFAGDVRAVFISFNGFTPDCLLSLDASDERVILYTGHDLRSVLECEIALDVMLHDTQAYLIKNKENYVSATEIIKLRSGR